MSVITIEKDFGSEVKKAIKYAGYTQGDFARLLGLDPCVLSCKLSGKIAYLTVLEKKQAIILLAQIQGINRREEVSELLRLAGLRTRTFSQADWETTALSLLD
jgi:transcriptional regulator with XRE-family HTH domain